MRHVNSLASLFYRHVHTVHGLGAIYGLEEMRDHFKDGMNSGCQLNIKLRMTTDTYAAKRQIFVTDFMLCGQYKDVIGKVSSSLVCIVSYSPSDPLPFLTSRVTFLIKKYIKLSSPMIMFEKLFLQNFGYHCFKMFFA